MTMLHSFDRAMKILVKKERLKNIDRTPTFQVQNIS